MKKGNLYQKVYGSPFNSKSNVLYHTKEKIKEYAKKLNEKARVGYDLGLSLTTNKLSYGLIRYQGVPPRVDDYNIKLDYPFQR